MATAAVEQEIMRESPDHILRKLAQETLAVLGEDYEELPSRLRWLLRKEKAKYFDILVDWAAEELTRHTIMASRTPKAVKAQGKDRGLAALGDEFNRNYQAAANFCLSDGTPLIDANPAQVVAQSQFYRSQGTTMMARADWLAAVAKAVGEANRVGDVLKPKALYEMRREAETTWGIAE